MGSKRARKARKRVQRQNRRETRRARQAPATDQQDAKRDDPHIGFIAEDGFDLVRYEGECIVAGSREEMQRTVAILCPETKATIYRVSFEQLFRMMNETGEVFRFDDEAYARLLEPARRRGISDL